MGRLRTLVVLIALAVAGCSAATTPRPSGDDGGELDDNARCQALITNAEIQAATGVADLAFDPTGSVTNLADNPICPYQNKAGVEVIVSVYRAASYSSGFQTLVSVAKDAPSKQDVAGLGRSAYWVRYANQLLVDTGGTGIQIDFLYKGGADELAAMKDIATVIAKKVVGRV